MKLFHPADCDADCRSRIPMIFTPDTQILLNNIAVAVETAVPAVVHFKPSRNWLTVITNATGCSSKEKWPVLAIILKPAFGKASA